jgi:hypothetical protein
LKGMQTIEERRRRAWLLCRESRGACFAAKKLGLVWASRNGPMGLRRVGYKQNCVEDAPAEALASCCGVNLAGGQWGWRFFAAARVISVLPRIRREPVNERIGLRWSDRVNSANRRVCFLSLLFLFPEDRASRGWLPEMGPWGYGGLGTRQNCVEDAPAEALASCCGVNLAGGQWGGGFFAAARVISEYCRESGENPSMNASACCRQSAARLLITLR